MRETPTREPTHFQNAIREIGEQLEQLERLQNERREELYAFLKTTDDPLKANAWRNDLARYKERIRQWKESLLERLLESVSFQELIDERQRVLEAIDESAWDGLGHIDETRRVQQAGLLRQEQHLTRLLRLPFDIDQHVFYDDERPDVRGYLAPNGDMLVLDGHNGRMQLLPAADQEPDVAK